MEVSRCKLEMYYDSSLSHELTKSRKIQMPPLEAAAISFLNFFQMPSLGVTAIRFFFFQMPPLRKAAISFFSKTVVQVYGFCRIHLPSSPTTALRIIFVNSLHIKLI